jgi:hypothetical protein
MARAATFSISISGVTNQTTCPGDGPMWVLLNLGVEKKL